MQPVKEELEQMVQLGVKASVEQPTAGMVVVPKPSGKVFVCLVCICLDQIKLNKSFWREWHPLTSINQVLAQLSEAKTCHLHVQVQGPDLSRTDICSDWKGRPWPSPGNVRAFQITCQVPLLHLFSPKKCLHKLPLWLYYHTHSPSLKFLLKASQ